MNPEDIVKESAVFTADRMGTDGCVKILRVGLGLFGTEILSHITEADRAGLFVPINLAVDSKELAGCIQTLKDRAIFAWLTGTFRTKKFSTVVPYDTITDVVADIRPATSTGQAMDRLVVKAEKDWTLLFREAGPVPRILHGVLNGSVTFGHHEEPGPLNR